MKENKKSIITRSLAGATGWMVVVFIETEYRRGNDFGVGLGNDDFNFKYVEHEISVGYAICRHQTN